MFYYLNIWSFFKYQECDGCAKIYLTEKKWVPDLCLSKCPKTCSHTSGLIGEINNCVLFDKNEESYQAVGKHGYGIAPAASSSWDGALSRADAEYEGAGTEGKGLQAQPGFAVQHSRHSPAPQTTRRLCPKDVTQENGVISNRSVSKVAACVRR